LQTSNKRNLYELEVACCWMFVITYLSLLFYFVDLWKYNSAKGLITGKCRHLVEAMRVLATVSDYEFCSRRDRVDAVEEDDVVDLTGPEVRSATGAWRHVHRLHPVCTTGVATVDAVRRTSILAEYLQYINSEDKSFRQTSGNLPYRCLQQSMF